MLAERKLFGKHILEAILQKKMAYMTGIKCFSEMLSVIDLIIHIFENKISYVFKYKCDCIHLDLIFH